MFARSASAKAAGGNQTEARGAQMETKPGEQSGGNIRPAQRSRKADVLLPATLPCSSLQEWGSPKFRRFFSYWGDLVRSLDIHFGGPVYSFLASLGSIPVASGALGQDSGLFRADLGDGVHFGGVRCTEVSLGSISEVSGVQKLACFGIPSGT